MIQAPARSDVEILIERFNQWADERIADLAVMPTLPNNRPRSLHPRIDTLESVKINLKRLAEEIDKG